MASHYKETVLTSRGFDIPVEKSAAGFGSWRRTARKVRAIISNLRPVDVSAVIDRTFRFLEMSFLAALVGLAYSVVDEEWSMIITLVMSSAAGVYLAIPIVGWMPNKNGVSRTFFEISALSLLLGAANVQLILPLQTLVRATFQIDQKEAIADYARLQGRMVFTACARGNGSFEECVQAGKAAEQRILAHDDR